MSTWVELIWGVVQQMISMVLTEANMFQETPGTHFFSEKTVRKNFPVRKSPSSSSLGQKKSCWYSSPKGTFLVHFSIPLPLSCYIPAFSWPLSHVLSLQWTAPCQHEPNLAGLDDPGTLPNPLEVHSCWSSVRNSYFSFNIIYFTRIRE